MLSLNVAAERAELARIERQIVHAKQDIRTLQTELGTRGRLEQLEQWNAEVLALSAPSAAQFLESEVVLARFETREPTIEDRAKVHHGRSRVLRRSRARKLAPADYAAAAAADAKESKPPGPPGGVRRTAQAAAADQGSCGSQARRRQAEQGEPGHGCQRQAGRGGDSRSARNPNRQTAGLNPGSLGQAGGGAAEAGRRRKRPPRSGHRPAPTCSTMPCSRNLERPPAPKRRMPEPDDRSCRSRADP